MTKEVVYFKRLILIMNINFPLPLSIVKIICPQIVSKYLPRTTTIKLLKAHIVKNTFLRRIWESLNMESLRREGICQLLHSLVFKSFSLLCSLPGGRPHLSGPTQGLKLQYSEIYPYHHRFLTSKKQSITESCRRCFTNPSPELPYYTHYISRDCYLFLVNQ